MQIEKFTINNSKRLLLDENNNIKEIIPQNYIIAINDKYEYENIECNIFEALENNIHVYQYIANAFKLEIDCKKILAYHDQIILFSTNDENKYEILESIIKNIMLKNKKTLS